MEGQRLCALILVSISLLFLLVSQLDQDRISSMRSSQIHHGEFPTDFAFTSITILLNSTASEEIRNPKILAWTSYFSRRLDDRIRSDTCPFRCDVYNRSQLSEAEADAIVFHFRDLGERMPLPKSRRTEQIYVSFLKEAPPHAGVAVYLHKFAENFFNATVDYRLNNFTYFDHPRIIAAVSEEEKKYVQPLSEGAVNELFLNKTDTLLAIISNCHAESGRLQYLEELSKHINMTRVGTCFGGRRSEDDVKEMIKSHHFVVALENVECKDYATEKFWRITQDIVPVVLRRRILKGLAPDSAFVAADDFENPEKLAEHLIKSAGSKEEYRKYFAWRNTHYRDQVDGFCNLCRDLHFKNVSTRANLNMKEYYSISRECEMGTAVKLLGGAH